MPSALLTLAALSLAFAPAPFLPKKAAPVPETDEQILQGEWTEMDSSDHNKPSSNNVKYIFAGKDVTVTQSGTVVSRWVLNVRPPGAAGEQGVLDMPAAGGGGGRLVYRYTLKRTPVADWVTFHGRGVFRRARP